ncbi:pirin family protein [Brevundimonas sp.]|jgi:hypothetical protein|uniref:pirin family protein n=1 Tax=Brevundimonas sp. TaxID=1871086 RepID=UPI0028B13154|nr:pirin family protein [Brevundimonas sp.]
MSSRSIDRITAIPPLGPGFDGDHHRAALVIAPGDMPRTDPFFLMADDHITVEGGFGEAHPHAGLETVTFMLKGTMADTGGRLDEGDVEWMTAGSGIVHSEQAKVSEGMRLFQLWLTLPEAQRNMDPRVQIIRGATAPAHREEGVEATVYSGRLGDAVSPTLNAVPVTLADIRLEPGVVWEPELPSVFNAFVVVIEGQAAVGETSAELKVGTVGWSGPVGDGDGALALRAGQGGVRLLLYAGAPQKTPVVSQGPFIAGSREELAGYYAAYRNGAFPHAGNMRPLVS